MSYSFLGAEDPCANLNFFERWFTPACRIAETNAANSGDTSTDMFSGVRVGTHTYNCSPNPLAPMFRCGSWATGQGLTNAMAIPLQVTYMDETRWLSPGGTPPGGISETAATRDESIARALAQRTGDLFSSNIGIGIAVAAGVVALAGATYLVLGATGRPKRRR